MSKKIIEKHINQILDYIDVSPEMEIIDNDNAFKVEIRGDSLSFLIGYRGESLDALQHIVRQAVFREIEEWFPITIDINDYKQGKLEKLEDTVKGLIDRVRFHRKEIKLPPLNAYERRHVHTFVSNYVDVESESRGEGKERRLFILPSE